MSRIEPFAEWIHESDNSDLKGASLAELKRLREAGLLHGDGDAMYQLAIDKFMEDPEVNAAIDTLKSKFAEITGAIFPYDEYEREWENIQQQVGDDGIAEVGWFEYLMFAY